MKVEGLILDESDIRQETKKVFNSTDTNLVGKINMIVTNPTQTITVDVPKELWNNGESGKLFKQLVAQRFQYSIEIRDLSFADDEGKHREIKGYRLHQLPELNNK